MSRMPSRKFTIGLVQTNASGTWKWTARVHYGKHTIFETSDVDLTSLTERASNYILEYLDNKSS